jgi:hypothetical protein
VISSMPSFAPKCHALRRVQEMLPQGWDWTGATAAAQDGGSTGSSEVARELGELQLAYHSLVTAIVTNNLLPTLQHSPALNHIMEASVLVCCPLRQSGPPSYAAVLWSPSVGTHILVAHFLPSYLNVHPCAGQVACSWHASTVGACS